MALVGPSLAAAAERVYWANTATNQISYASVDGSGAADVNVSGATVDKPAGVATDPIAGRVYWTNSGGNAIGFARLDGSDGGVPNTTGVTIDDPVGVSIDPVTGVVYLDRSRRPEPAVLRPGWTAPAAARSRCRTRPWRAE